MKNNSFGIKEALDIYAVWGYWLWLAVLVAGQFLLLLLPINIAERRLPARRPLKIPVIVTAFFLANLVFAGIFSILCAIVTDKAFDYFNLFAMFSIRCRPKRTEQQFRQRHARRDDFDHHRFLDHLGVLFSIVPPRSDDPDALLKRATRWLLRGSILELIIAVPSHVIVRRRDDCCAPIGTFWGIATGLSVMLLCFGPGVFFLCIERCRKLKPKPALNEGAFDPVWR